MNSSISKGRYLKDIVPFLNLDAQWQQTMVTGLAVDSRKVRAGDCFIAYRGDHADGRAFLLSAENAGASCALIDFDGDVDNQQGPAELAIPVVKVKGLRQHLGQIASAFYQAPSEMLSLCAVTGTNGKTSVSQLIAQGLENAGHRCGVIGTLGSGFPGQVLNETGNTTPGVVENNRLLKEMLDAGAEYAVMEASSHGLVQGRLDGLNVAFGVITNISRDHLDYHGSMEAYREAKALLAKNARLRGLVLNADDNQVLSMASMASPSTQVLTFSTKSATRADVCAEAIQFHQAGIDIKLTCQGASGEIKSPMVGDFNASNLLAAATTLVAMGVSLDRVCAGLSTVAAVPGRMQKVPSVSNSPLVIVDFAHTPDALEKALLAARRHCVGKLWCVFGCGGDRDAGKRPLMAAMASQFADEIVLTADNPRSEKLSDIFSTMVKGIPDEKAYVLIEDRRQAVMHAVRNATSEDVVVVAGKGHENYQDVMGVKYPHSDMACAEQALSMRAGPAMEGNP
ncbi:UDP-N-acetylmuramoyl-L-alanyl-D-glutamate--2,6-diaminopimelate ligase [Ketobacter sp. MCCC 1A13808]|uniref:UDP-N-acetylmuramoyl-L-alanyl-D-glutamate--2, 6-diaminopimelate ligase n=1 Tax=Ketobacter sp. MCCC 1A13808 TaxID=2602738 RepID=UPI0012EB43EE|nr:UDP-N-acetylmuramoyl-L-alanyl-D-glutamate--2,6-diaminopimelate ligase [Ketobacter sp. MCCC 1A13808]MVF11209.1 UDP-N-acetylmuramoyl-L-alanyl-D-glutamate--2,6-diaminopimelate ligase [Ketobacter sp. MCCC 1A13808]